MALGRKAVSFLFLLLTTSSALFGQTIEEALPAVGAPPTEPVEPTEIVYTDLLFNKYIELENRILLDEAELSQELYEIRQFKVEVESAGRRDILSRLEMLSFIVKTRLDESLRITEAESITGKIISDEELRLAGTAAKNSQGVLTAAAIGTTLVSGIIFLGSSIIYEDFYNKYTATDYADQGAFYLFWWQTCKTTSMISGLTTAVAALTSGIFAIIF